MEKRIKEGGCSLPRQQGWLEKQLFASYSNGFFGQHIADPVSEEEERRHINIWSDMEKCIFLDRFLHHPKDFRRIAFFLRNKTTKDCIQFYYNSKKSVPYKHALKEFLQRKRRRGDVVSWDATIQACLAMGAIIKAGSSPEQPLIIKPPAGDYTYHTKNFHPMKLEVFRDLQQTVLNVKQPDEIKSNHGKRKRSNWFILDAQEKKYLKHGESSDDYHSSRKKSAIKAFVSTSSAETSKFNPLDNASDGEEEDSKKVHARKSGSKSMLNHHDSEKKQQQELQPEFESKSWKEKESKLCFDALVKHGRDWQMISELVGTRTPTEVKNYYYENKKSIAKQKERNTKALRQAERAAAAEALILGTKKKKTKRTKKTQNATNITPASGVHEKKSTKKDLPPSTNCAKASTDCAKASTDCAKDSCSEVKVQSTQSQGMHAQKHAQNGPIPTDFASSNSSTNNTDQGEQYRQHQLLLHQQHQDQLRQQLQIQHRQHQDQLRQQLQRQQQEEMYRQHHQRQQQEEQQQRQRQQQQLQQHHSTNPQFRD